jgi:hypothetical protein
MNLRHRSLSTKPSTVLPAPSLPYIGLFVAFFSQEAMVLQRDIYRHPAASETNSFV